MRKLAVAVLVCAAVVALGPASARAAGKPVYAGTCGLPNNGPLWIDFGWPEFASIFGRAGVIVSGSSGDWPAQMRAAGARTVYWDMYLRKRVGQPNTPADPATIVDKANRLYEFASGQMGCSTPVIVENELNGASLVTPWSDTNTTYRQNVLTFLRQLAARGAYPVLLVNSVPYTAGDAGLWWQQVAGVADIVREAYFPATLLYGQGPVLANRTLRTSYRRDIEDFTSIGIPPHRLGLMATMATTKGVGGGRNGLEPASAWYEVVKWQVLSMRQIAAETGISTLWSWGWSTRTKAEADPDKWSAACVWLWARSSTLCDGPAAAGPSFDRSLTEGQIRLGSGVQCLIGRERISIAAIRRLQLVTGDRDVAFSALYARLVESDVSRIPSRRVYAAERVLVAQRFGGSWSRYAAALASAHATRAVARDILADELRRAQIEADLRFAEPSGAAVSTFYRSYPDVLARLVQTTERVSWLGDRKRGFALSAFAPESVFDLPLGRRTSLRTPLGLYKVTALGATALLGALPLEQVRPGIVATLRSFARGAAYESWSASLQARMLKTTICARDDLPAPTKVDLSTYLPFLAVST